MTVPDEGMKEVGGPVAGGALRDESGSVTAAVAPASSCTHKQKKGTNSS